MKPTRLRLEPRPSRIACAFIASACSSVAALIVALSLPPWTSAAALAAVAAVAARGFWRCTGRGVPALIHVGHDRRITATSRDGRSRDGSIQDDSYVGPRVTTIVWRPDRAAWWVPASSILLLPDMLPADDFRRLRVVLRYGRPVVEEATSDAEAG
jgi:hypothetical protein